MISEIDDLRIKTIDAFKKLPEVSEIFTFGSISLKKADKYSDIDLTIITNDIYETTRNLINVLKSIDDIDAIFIIENKKTSSAYSIFFKSYSLYNKIDLGITLPGSELFENSKQEYKSSHNFTLRQTEPMKLEKDLQELLIMDTIIGSLKYLKYINRKKILIAYKFYRSFFELYLKNLTNSESITLNTFIEVEKSKQKINDLIFIKSEIEMSHAYFKYLRKYLKRYKNDQLSKETNKFIKRTLNLWKDELKHK